MVHQNTPILYTTWATYHCWKQMTLFFLMCSSDWKYYKAGTHKKYITPVLHLATVSQNTQVLTALRLFWIVFSYYHIKIVGYLVKNINHFTIFILLCEMVVSFQFLVTQILKHVSLLFVFYPIVNMLLMRLIRVVFYVSCFIITVILIP